MRSIVHVAALAAAMSLSVAAPPPALAAVGVSFNLGDVSVGYRDGYYDSHHRWHRWHHADDWKAYRDAHPEHYRDYGHDRDRDHDH